MCLRVTFASQLHSEGSLKMVKALSLKLNQCFAPFTMSPVKRSSQTGAFKDLSNHVFRVWQFWKYIRYEGHFFLKMFDI